MRNVARQASTTAANDQRYALSFTRGLPDLYLDRAGLTPTLAGSVAAAGRLVCSDVAGVRRSRNALLVSGHAAGQASSPPPPLIRSLGRRSSNRPGRAALGPSGRPCVLAPVFAAARGWGSGLGAGRELSTPKMTASPQSPAATRFSSPAQEGRSESLRSGRRR